MSYLYLLIGLIVLSPSWLFAQDDAWKAETAKGGTKIKYRYSNVVNADGDEDLMVEFEAIKTVAVNLDDVVTCMNEGASYTYIIQYVEASKNVGVSPNGGWYLYEFIDAPWPIPNTDCILEVTMKRPNTQELIVYHNAKPNAYPMGDIRRNEVSDMSFHFKRLGNGTVQLTLTAKFIPVFTPPKFLLNTWFPSGPEGIIDRLVEQANKI